MPSCSRMVARTSVPPMGWHYVNQSLTFQVPNEKLYTIVAEKGVRVRGVVVDPENQPVGDVTVAMMHPGEDGRGRSTALYGVKSDADGHFEMLLPASKDVPFRLVACDSPGAPMSTNLRTRRRWADGRCAEMHSQPGEELDKLTIRLARPATIRGRLLDAFTTSSKVPRPLVQVDWPSLDRFMWVPDAKVDEETGEFELPFVPPGEQALRLVRYWDGGNAISTSKVTPLTITLREGETTTGLVLSEVIEKR